MEAENNATEPHQRAGAVANKGGHHHPQRETVGHTNVANAPQYHLGDGAWIEHATAQVGDVLSAAELSAAVALATKQQAAVAAYQAQERIDGPARAAKAAKEAQDAADAALEAKIDARVKAALAAAKSAK